MLVFFIGLKFIKIIHTYRTFLRLNTKGFICPLPWLSSDSINLFYLVILASKILVFVL